jgi:hypothetical protein
MTLANGYSFGSPMAFCDLAVGDVLYSPATASRGNISGKVLKVNRVTIVLEGWYFEHRLELKVRRDEFLPVCWLQRAKLVHPITF